MCNVEAHNKIQLILPPCHFFQRWKLLDIFRYLVGCSVYHWRLKTLLVTLKFTSTRKLCSVIRSSAILPEIGSTNIFLTFTLKIVGNKEAIKLMLPDTACFKVCPRNSPFCQFTFCAVAA